MCTNISAALQLAGPTDRLDCRIETRGGNRHLRGKPRQPTVKCVKTICQPHVLRPSGARKGSARGASQNAMGAELVLRTWRRLFTGRLTAFADGRNVPEERALALFLACINPSPGCHACRREAGQSRKSASHSPRGRSQFLSTVYSNIVLCRSAARAHRGAGRFRRVTRTWPASKRAANRTNTSRGSM